MRKIFIIIFLISVLFGQARIGGWYSYTSTLNINQIVEYENSLLCVTDGGLLLFDTNEQKFASLTNIDGLVTTKLNCIELGTSGYIWIGGGNPNGFVQIYNIVDQTSISEFNYDMSEIIDFAVSDSIVYAIYRDNNDYGLIEFNYHEYEFIHKDLYPNWPMGNQINEIEIYGTQVFVATEVGLYFGEVGTDPNNWELLVGTPVKSIFLNDEFLYYFTNNVLYRYDIDLEVIYESVTVNDYIIDITALNDTIILLSDENLYKVSGSDLEEILIDEDAVNCLYSIENSEIVLGTKTGLAFIDYNNSLDFKIPNSPHQNNFQAITVLEDGRFVAGGGNGIAIKESDGWRNIVESNDAVIIQDDKDYNYFIGDSIPVDFGGSISKMVQGPDGLLYCSIEGTYPSRNGGGVIIIDIDNPTNFTIVDTTYLDYYSNEYLVVKDIDFDRDDFLWIADAYATTKHEPLHVRSYNNEWNSFNAEDSDDTMGLTPSTIAIDAWLRVWVGSFQDSDRNVGFPDGGLTMLSYSGDPTQPDNYQWHRIYLDNTDENETIWSLAITSENRMYMLTPVGLTFVDLQFADDDPIKYESPRYYFPNISFGQESEVRLDARGNAWAVSSSDGIHVLLNNSTYWPDENENLEVESINTENYPLLSDNVTDIAFNNEEGVAYISTNSGINSFRIPFANSKKNYSEIRVFPSPFHVPSDKPLIVDNLKDNSSLKVMTISGKVIRSLETSELGMHGYQIEWDGRDEYGNWVNSGVYLLSIYSEDGSQAFEKVVVIRH